MTLDADTGFTRHVLHRLALGVEPIDAARGRPVGTPIRVVREGVAEPRGARRRRADPLLRAEGAALESTGGTRFKLRHGRGVGASVVLRIDDPARRHVARRLAVDLWTVGELEAEPARPVPVASRVVRPWLWPGTAYPVGGGITGVRGRVRRAGGVVVPWPRIVARTLDGALVLGRAHGDDRGEFLLALGDTGRVGEPASEFDVQLVMHGPPPGEQPVPALEKVPRSSAPPLPGELDSPVLRGEAVPEGYGRSSASPALTVPVGRLLDLTDDLIFWP